MDIVPVVDEGLGNSSYLVGLGDGGALVVDPFRNPFPYLAAAEQRGWTIRYAAETHLHADFVSGSRELSASGAEVLASAGAALGFPATLLRDGEERELGGLSLRALATPGHTPEHLAYLLCDGPRPAALFTGGTLIVGGAARPDLLGPDNTEPLARATYRSAQSLLELPDSLGVYPTHGAGSFCSSGADDERVSTIGEERAGNWLLQAADEDEFVSRLLGGLGSYPPYFLELRAVNQAGPDVVGPMPGPLRQLSPSTVRTLVDDGATLVDVRGLEAFAQAHVPGSVSNPMRTQFATWLGWLVDREDTLVFVADADVDRQSLLWACLGIGFDRVAGELAGGLPAWIETGGPVSRVPLLSPEAVGAGSRLLDVRQESEWNNGHVPGSLHVELGDLARHNPDVGSGPVFTYCGHGERAMSAASMLARQGHTDVGVVFGGPEEIARRRGVDLERTA